MLLGKKKINYRRLYYNNYKFYYKYPVTFSNDEIPSNSIYSRINAKYLPNYVAIPTARSTYIINSDLK